MSAAVLRLNEDWKLVRLSAVSAASSLMASAKAAIEEATSCLTDLYLQVNDGSSLHPKSSAVPISFPRLGGLSWRQH
jgi:hypothetical protein